LLVFKNKQGLLCHAEGHLALTKILPLQSYFFKAIKKAVLVSFQKQLEGLAAPAYFIRDIPLKTH